MKCKCGASKHKDYQDRCANGHVYGGHITHGHASDRYSPTYITWMSMRQRCSRSKYYAGKGIKVCSRWESSFENFLDDMGERPEGHTIERTDRLGNYEPSNCQWVTSNTQNRNRSFVRLNEEAVKVIRHLCRTRPCHGLMALLARLHGVKHYVVNKVVLGDTWK